MPLIFWLVNGLSGFTWSAENKHTGLAFLAVLGLVFGAFALLPYWLAFGIGAMAATWSSVHSARALLRSVSIGQVPRVVVRLLKLVEAGARGIVEEEDRIRDAAHQNLFAFLE